MFIIQCDKCKTNTEPKKDVSLTEGWRNLFFTQGYPHGQLIFHLCPECVEILKLPEIGEKSLPEKLLDIISELVKEAVDNR